MMELKGTDRRVLTSEALDGGAPEEVLLAPWGTVRSTKGDFVVDAEGVREAIEAFAAHGTDVPIDYEHQTLGGAYASPTGQAPAAGWIKRLIARAGEGLFAAIEWTESAKAQLASKAYRYLSPVALVRKRDRRLVGIHSAALTNKPAIVGMSPVVNSEGLEGEDGLSPLALLRRDVGLGEEADVAEVLAAAGRRISELEEDARRRRVAGRIGEAMREGKLVEAQRQWAEELMLRDEGLFDRYLRATPVVVASGRTSPPSASDGARGLESRAHRARIEYRGSALLQKLTDEEAYVAEAVRGG